MKQVYLVMSEELLEDNDRWRDSCRAFATRQEAEEFKKVLEELFEENQDFENETRFFVKPVPFGAVEEEV